MPNRSQPWPAGTPCWVDLSVPSADLGAAKEFYGAVFGWSFLDLGPDFGHYQICQVDGRAAAAIGPLMAEGQPSAWQTYLASDDVDGTAKSIAANGGTLFAEPMDVPGAGRMCVALDPAGAPFGVWQAGGSIGIEIYNEPGGLVWNDTRQPDPDAARQFYAEVFGYRYQPVRGAPPDYTTIHLDGDPVGGMGGMMGAPAGTPAHWVAYFSVADADAAVAAATAGGGSVLGGPDDTPYGRIAFLTDPNGAVFAVMGPVA
ncbi:MAG: VOC family protein [Pseudonocardiales bacterium]|nr:VOC family protein [Actinomycetota bacterium]PZS18377.1 MAG: VOC family protein [Pseudonocardiales bacterium]